MDNYEYNELLKSLKIKVDNIAKVINPTSIQSRLKEIEAIEQDPSFWSDVAMAGQIGKEKTKISSMLNKFQNAKNLLNDSMELFDLANSENDLDTINSLFDDSVHLEETITNLEVAMMLSSEDDSKNAIVSIHPGAGGTESNDWASMLYRMYLRFCEREGFKVETLDFQEGDEAGLKDVSFIVKGENAYGYLKAENGIHRLVRTSPFDSAGRRHTSFSSVMVSNKTESAVRITHHPTRIVVQCQNDRSQHKNKATALKMLKSRLYELELEKQRAASQSVEKSEMGWGHQIRSYVLFPYKQVKDNRSNIAYSQADAVLDGDIKKIIEAVLISQKSNN